MALSVRRPGPFGFSLLSSEMIDEDICERAAPCAAPADTPPNASRPRAVTSAGTTVAAPLNPRALTKVRRVTGFPNLVIWSSGYLVIDFTDFTELICRVDPPN